MTRRASAARAARRTWPYLLMAWERWQALPEERKREYRARAREYADRGRRALESRGGGGRRR
jgi:hypothetical protein